MSFFDSIADEIARDIKCLTGDSAPTEPNFSKPLPPGSADTDLVQSVNVQSEFGKKILVRTSVNFETTKLFSAAYPKPTPIQITCSAVANKILNADWKFPGLACHYLLVYGSKDGRHKRLFDVSSVASFIVLAQTVEMYIVTVGVTSIDVTASWGETDISKPNSKITCSLGAPLIPSFGTLAWYPNENPENATAQDANGSIPPGAKNAQIFWGQNDGIMTVTTAVGVTVFGVRNNKDFGSGINNSGLIDLPGGITTLSVQSQSTVNLNSAAVFEIDI